MNGFVLPALSIGLGAIRVKPTRGFFPASSDAGPVQPLVAHATLEEVHTDEIEITAHPVERGAQISDHAIIQPKVVVIRCAWSNSPSTNPGLLGAAIGAASVFAPVTGRVVGALQTINAAKSLLSGDAPDQVKAIYKQLLELQSSRIPFTVYTGKRKYETMLFKSLSVTTDGDSENALLLTAVCRQVIIASTQTVRMPMNPNAMKYRELTPLSNTGQRQLQAVRNAALNLGL